MSGQAFWLLIFGIVTRGYELVLKCTQMLNQMVLIMSYT
jgi:hypothetical protein